MMPWLVEGVDASSDDGYFQIIVDACDEAECKRIARKLFRKLNRLDLKVGKVKPLREWKDEVNGVIHHTVEPHC